MKSNQNNVKRAKSSLPLEWLLPPSLHARKAIHTERNLFCFVLTSDEREVQACELEHHLLLIYAGQVDRVFNYGIAAENKAGAQLFL